MKDLKQFYNEVKNIDLSNSNVDKQRETLVKSVENFISKIDSISVNENLKEQNQELSKILVANIDEIKDLIQNWHKNFQHLSELEKFNTYLQNYFIIIIYGKVKAGKSTLGNFVAKHKLDDQQLEFFRYDKAGQEQKAEELKEIDEDDEAFRTDTLEATAEIQGFRLDSLAWIDTPGLGSMTTINGKLAQKYIESADFIIFPINSSEPFQRDEIEEVKKLFNRGKKVTICLTKSDTVGRKKDSNGKFIKENGKIKRFRINKDNQRRQEQEEYVKEELKKILPKDKDSLIGDILSLSTLTASLGLKENDNELFENSNIIKLYDRLADVVKNKASLLKKANPYEKLLAIINNDILGESKYSIKVIEDILKGIDKNINEAIKEFDFISKSINSDIQAKVENVVSKYMLEIDKSNYQSYFGKIDEELEQDIQTLIGENIQNIMQNFNTKTDFIQQSKRNDFSIEDKYETIRVRYRDPDLLNTLTFGIFGREYSSKREKVYLGDNKDETILEFKQDRINLHIQNAQENYELVKNSFFKELQSYSNEIKHSINQLKSDLSNIKTNIAKDLSYDK
jgi:adenylate kinase family enzyme